MDITKAITHVSLCAGYGGIDLGLSRAIPSLRTVAFSEIEAFACANLVSKMEAGLLDAAPIWTDLKTFPWRAFRDRVDILSGGYPCQPFSAAGKRLGTDDPRHLWPFIANGIRTMRPRMCFFENVEGHISLGLREIIGELESMGYSVSWGIFSAREVGAPHQRKRVFILAHRKCEGLEGWRCSSKSESTGCRSSSDIGESSNVLVNSINNDGSDICGVEHGEAKQSIFSIPSGNVADSNNSGSGQDQLLSELRTIGIEQPPRCSRLPSQSTKTREVTVWPSRPREPQYGWEPSRVVANSASERTNAGQQLCDEECGQGRALPLQSDDSGESMGNAQHDGSHQCDTETRGAESCGEQGWVQEPERRSASMGDTETRRRGRSGDETSEGQGHRSARSSRSDEELSEVEPALGRDSDGSADWLDDAELYTSCDNRTDELRLLGNGVVPATAERAFRTLLAELNP